jgi:AcrR family transcriptional regulator
MSERISDVRERIVRAAAELLADGGREAVSTRAVSAAAGVQAPTIYRQFGDMRGLLDAVAQETFAGYVRQKAAHQRTDDPLADLRRGWDLHVAFGLANPAAYALMHSDPALTTDSPAARDAAAMLEEQLARVAEAGRLRVSVPQAARMISAAARGVVLSLIGAPPDARDPRLSEAVREAVLAAVTVAPGADDGAVDSTPGRVAARAVALRAVLDEAPDVLSAAERQLLGEWLDRLTGAGD